MFSIGQVKEEARNALVRNYGRSVLIAFIMMLLYAQIGALTPITMGTAAFSVVSMCISIFICNPLTVGICRFWINAARGKGNISDIGYGFDASYMRNAVTILLMYVFVALWSFLLVIPGIIKMYEYAMVPYIIADDPGVSRKDAFRRSKEMMKGNKWRTFLLDLSFIFWHLLSIVTLTIVGMLYVNPYHQLARASLYAKLCNDSSCYDTPAV